MFEFVLYLKYKKNKCSEFCFPFESLENQVDTVQRSATNYLCICFSSALWVEDLMNDELP